MKISIKKSILTEAVRQLLKQVSGSQLSNNQLFLQLTGQMKEVWQSYVSSLPQGTIPKVSQFTAAVDKISQDQSSETYKALVALGARLAKQVVSCKQQRGQSVNFKGAARVDHPWKHRDFTKPERIGDVQV